MTDGLASPAPQRFFAAAWILGALRAQRFMWSESWCALRGRTRPSTRFADSLGPGRRFALGKGPWMGVLVPMVVISQFVDVLLAQGLLHLVVPAGPPRWLAHSALLFVSLWTVVWAVSWRSATRHVDHVLGERALTLAIGFRHLARLPLAAIAGVQVVDHKAARGRQDWFDVHGLKPRDVTAFTFLDTPTLLIELRPDAAGAWRTANGVRKPLRRWLAVHVDEPAAMRQAIAAALPVREIGD